ncbi:unnamed protein product [Clavelina lepadiformis]|uniref:HAT C-terminal dimerisation domain-containing protein n=1 Tax=Clavelina lepadiformis TaxID=159417 RepID=A0ABP0F407_CLALP
MEFVRQTDSFEINLQQTDCRVAIEHIYVGVAATATLAECFKRDLAGVRKVRLSCLNFIIELVDQIRKRFKEVKNESFHCLEFLIPDNAIRCIPPTLTGVYNSFKFLKDVAPLDLVDLEWRKQAIEEPCSIKNGINDEEFWRNRLSQKSVVGEIKYKNLRNVVACLLSLPFANAPVERLFSTLKEIKTDHRNCMKRESLVGLLHTQQGMKSLGIPADKLYVKDHPEMLKMVKSVKSNATDTEVHEHIAAQMSSWT